MADTVSVTSRSKCEEADEVDPHDVINSSVREQGSMRCLVVQNKEAILAYRHDGYSQYPRRNMIEICSSPDHHAREEKSCEDCSEVP